MEHPTRKSHRYKQFDYSSGGAYFVTICVAQGRSLLGNVLEGKMQLSEAGQAVAQSWDEIIRRFPLTRLDAHTIMPNHVHWVVWLESTLDTMNRYRDNDNSKIDPPGSRPKLGEIVRVFKSTSAIAANRVLGRTGRFWQRDYWDRIIRNDEELNLIRTYIQTNPERWREDKLHPEAAPNKFNQWGNS